MIKVVRPDSFNFDQPVATLVDVHSHGVDSCWLQKSAAVLTKELSEIRPEAGKTFMHLIALGDVEHYGANRNGDMFPKVANTAYHDTFVKYANFYRHHRNKPARGDKIYGNVKCSAYNPDMHRVELIIAIDNEAAPDTIEKIASGKDLAVSMACNVPFDVCSICGNQAKKEAEYCEHIKKHACEITRDGRQVGMINTQPTFFDISEVARNADRIAFTLRKVASHGDSPELSVITASRLGITAPMELVTPDKMSKVATLRELAAIERALGREVAQDYALRKTASVFGAPLGVELHVDDKTLPAVLGILKRADAILPMEDFFHLVMGEKFAQVAHHIPAAKAALPTIFTEMEKDAESAIFGIESYEPLDKPVQKAIKETAEGIAKSAAVSGIFADQRVMREMLTKRSGVVPYEKCAITKSGSFLAREYAKYKVAVLDGAALSVKRMAVLQHF